MLSRLNKPSSDEIQVALSKSISSIILQVEYSLEFWPTHQNPAEAQLDQALVSDLNSNRAFLERNLQDLMRSKHRNMLALVKKRCEPEELKTNLRLRNFTRLQESTVDQLSSGCSSGTTVIWERVQKIFFQLEVIVGRRSAYNKIQSALARIVQDTNNGFDSSETSAAKKTPTPASVAVALKVTIEQTLKKLELLVAAPKKVAAADSPPRLPK